MRSKKQLRQLMQDKLADLNSEESKNITEKMHQELFKLESWKNAEIIGIYLSFNTEWDTRGIINKAWNEGKKVTIPKTIPEIKGMDFYQFSDYNELESGHFGIEEPIVDETVQTEKKDIDLLIVPGLVFSEDGYRVGFGGGYYDRYLENFNNETLSLAWSEQILEELPINDYDIAVGKILTEKGIYN